MGHAKTAADGDGVAFHFAIDEVRHKSEVLREDVDVILGLDGDTDFEFAGEVKLPVNRVFSAFFVHGDGLCPDVRIDLRLSPVEIDFLAIKPDIRVGGGLPEEALAEFLREELGIGAGGILDWSGGGHGIAHHVAAGSHGGQAAAADAGDDCFEVAFEHAVELDSLTVSKADGAFGKHAQIVMDEPLAGGDAAARHFGADHEGPCFVLLFLGQGGTFIAVVLLIGAVKFEKHVFGIPDMGQGGVGEVFGDDTPEAQGL